MITKPNIVHNKWFTILHFQVKIGNICHKIWSFRGFGHEMVTKWKPWVKRVLWISSGDWSSRGWNLLQVIQHHRFFSRLGLTSGFFGLILFDIVLFGSLLCFVFFWLWAVVLTIGECESQLSRGELQIERVSWVRMVCGEVEGIWLRRKKRKRREWC